MSVFDLFFYFMLTPIFMLIIFSFITVFISQRKSNNLRRNFQVKSNINGKRSVMDKKSDHNSNHNDQANYSAYYSKKHDDKECEQIKDKPLSEAERNVLYGK